MLERLPRAIFVCKQDFEKQLSSKPGKYVRCEKQGKRVYNGAMHDRKCLGRFEQ
jgi:hypothetical protein